MKTRPAQLWLVLLALGGQSCSQKPSEAPPAAESAAAAPTAPSPSAAPQAAPAPAAPPELPAVPPGAKVSFLEPTDGAKVTGPLQNGKVEVHVKMGAEGIAIKPAGAVEAGSGHHHLVIDAPAVAPGDAVPKDEQHMHFGKGQTEATVELAPGPHTLQLQLGDGIHRSYGPALAPSIKVEVVAAGSAAASPAVKTH
jgi:hypothetical protein